MRRRDLVGLLASLTVSKGPKGQAQEIGRVYRLGVMIRGPRNDRYFVALLDGLRRLGFVEGRNLQIEGRFSTSDEEAPQAATKLVAAKVDAIVTGSYPRTRAAQKVTGTIPIVSVADDLVQSGLVTSLGHPDGNTTGVSILATELDGKRQSLLTELLPTARRIAALVDPTATPPERLEALKNEARKNGVELSTYIAATPEEIAPAVDAAKDWGAEGLNILASGLFNANQQRIIESVGAVRLPAMYQWPEMAEGGGLAAYGPRYASIYREQIALQLAKIFRGTKIADLPVEQPSKFELIINLKTAKALGLTVPQSLFARADEVIE
jgi:putative ABC transport system substrate-binding protein